jgi:hypothetical protein
MLQAVQLARRATRVWDPCLERRMCVGLSWENARAPPSSIDGAPEEARAVSKDGLIKPSMPAWARAGLAFRRAQHPAACIEAMVASGDTAGPKQRVFGIVTLTKALQRDTTRSWMTLKDAATCLRWLEPLLPAGAHRAANNVESLETSRSWPDTGRGSGTPEHSGKHKVESLTVRQAATLLVAIAKLSRAKRGWQQLLQDTRMQMLTDGLIENLSEGTLHLDPQVRFQSCVLSLMSRL